MEPSGIAHSDDRRDRTSTGRAALAGALAAALALATSTLLDGLFDAVPSLLVAIGDLVIDSAPGEVEQWAVSTLGSANKPSLVGGTIVLSVLFGAGLGVLAARRAWWWGAIGFVAFGAFGLWAATRDNAVGPATAAAVGATAAGVAALWWLLRSARAGAEPPVERTYGAQEAEPIGTRADRRDFLVAAGTATAAIAASATAGRLLQGRVETGPVAGGEAVLPSADIAAPTPPPRVSYDLEGLHDWVTPNEEFFRIDTALRVPRVDPDDWTLSFTGMVDNPYTLTYEELLAEPLEEHYITIACVSNEVGGDLVDNARWLGVRLDRLLERAGVQEAADQVVGRSVDGFTAGFPTATAFDGRDALVAIGMNGAPLPAEHGYPARLVVPGVFGYVSATKWLSEVELTTLDGFDAYWIPRGWAKFGPILTQSQIHVPARGATVPAGPTPIAGIAYAPTRGIERVQVRVDDGPWEEAELAAPYNEDTWRQWFYRWEATPGEHVLTCRAWDGNDEVQVAEASPVAPDGATGLHRIEVTVA